MIAQSIFVPTVSIAGKHRPQQGGRAGLKGSLQVLFTSYTYIYIYTHEMYVHCFLHQRTGI